MVPQRASRLVYWAEDNPGDRRLIEVALRDMGLEHPTVRFFGDGPTLLEAASEAVPDLVILDIKMPQLDGIEVLQRLRQANPQHDVPAVFFTSAPQEQERIVQARLPRTRIVTKPINFEDYAHAIRAMLHGP